MSEIRDKVLYPIKKTSDNPLPELSGNLGEAILQGFQDIFDQYGDFDWLINGPYDLKNETVTCSTKRKRISEVVPSARKVAAALASHGKTFVTVHDLLFNTFYLVS